MADTPRRLILGLGEKYIDPITKNHHGRPRAYPRSYEEARLHIRNEIDASLDKLAGLSKRKRYDDEAILCLRLHPDLTAKSYDPSGLLATVGELHNVGSRSYKTPVKSVAPTKNTQKLLENHIQEVTGRMVFIRSNDAGYRRLLKVLDASEQSLTDPFKDNIQSIEKFDLLDISEQLLGFPTDWKEGRVELVLHPTRHSEQEQMNFFRPLFQQSQVKERQFRSAFYPDGPAFISCFLTLDGRKALEGANPLRIAHPMEMCDFEDLGAAMKLPGPPPPIRSASKATIHVGMFDGGIDIKHPHLRGHAIQDENQSIDTPAQEQYVAHGTAVAGAILYGALNDWTTTDPLPLPQVSVVSVRVLPTSDCEDQNFYECIEIIEQTVPMRPDVKFWNISFGPRGPILDDAVSRFTYALDALAAEHKVTFCVAVGNDGKAGPVWGRIQAASDLVNGLGVGAYTEHGGEVAHAPYSCYGPGRECGKIKPDLAAFGGCDQKPIHLLATADNQKVLTYGTSFAAPQVAALGGQALGSVENCTALLSRALLIHHARHPLKKPDDLLGHGIMPASLDALTRCDANNVTVIYQDKLAASKSAKLRILLPSGLITSGKIQITCTIAVLPAVNALYSSDYTEMCIQDHFCPDSQKYTFTNPKKKSESKILHIVNDANEIDKLKANNWTVSTMPASDSVNKYRNEEHLRADQKWEPIVKRVFSKMASSLHEPFLVLHAIPRNSAKRPLDYAVVVTISAPDFNGDLYSEVRRRFSALQPIRLRAEAELRIRV